MRENEATTRIRNLTREIDEHSAALKIAADKRRELMIVLYEQHGFTLREIAEIVHISSARVAQIMGPRTP